MYFVMLNLINWEHHYIHIYEIMLSGICMDILDASLISSEASKIPTQIPEKCPGSIIS